MFIIQIPFMMDFFICKNSVASSCCTMVSIIVGRPACLWQMARKCDPECMYTSFSQHWRHCPWYLFSCIPLITFSNSRAYSFLQRNWSCLFQENKAPVLGLSSPFLSSPLLKESSSDLFIMKFLGSGTNYSNRNLFDDWIIHWMNVLLWKQLV